MAGDDALVERDSNHFLECDACRTRFHFPARRSFFYTDAPSAQALMEDERFHCTDVMRRPIWCHACNAPSFEERVPTLSDFALALRILRDPEGRMPTGLGAPEPDHELLFIGEEEGIEALQHLGERFINRAPSQRCLQCGAATYTRVDTSSMPSTLRHEACGGALHDLAFISSSNNRYVTPVIHTVRYFDWQCRFLWAIKFTTTLEGTSWVAHDIPRPD